MTGRQALQSTSISSFVALLSSVTELQASNSCAPCLPQTVYLAGDSTDEEQAAGDSKGDQEMLSESESDQDWDTDEDGNDSDQDDDLE